MLIGASVSGSQAAEAETAAAHLGTGHQATAHRVPGGAMKQVRFGGYTLEVPAGWPVYRLGRDPGRCVRYDQHAVYLGQPGADQQCPAHLVGRTATISVQAGPGPAGGPAYGGPVISRLPGSGGPVTGDPSGNLVHASLAGAGLSITGTYGGSPREVLSIIRSVRPVTATRPAQAAPAPARHRAVPRRARVRHHAAARHGAAGLVMAGSDQALPAGPAAAQSARGARHQRPRHHRPGHHRPGHHRHGHRHPGHRRPGKNRPRRHRSRREQAARPMHGFDSCAAPSLAVMRAWRPVFAAAAIYIGGAEQGCAQPNLSAAWVTAATRLGYALMPTYVGPQATCSGYSVRIRPSRAAAQGVAAAADAIRQARALGMGRGTPIYYDLEAYDGGNARCRAAALTFLDAWTRALHAQGYESGVYSSASSGAQNVGAATSAGGHRLAKPDSVWFGLWNARRNVYGSPYLRPDWWSGRHRIKQYLGPHLRTVGGRTVDIDSDWVYGAVYR